MLFILLQHIPLHPGHSVHTGLGPEGAALLPAGWVPWDGICPVLEQVGRDVGFEVCLLRGPGGHCAPSPPAADPLPTVSIQPKAHPLGSCEDGLWEASPKHGAARGWHGS